MAECSVNAAGRPVLFYGIGETALNIGGVPGKIGEHPKKIGGKSPEIGETA
ncbi:hypothetical protein [Weizmannia acidilactici]|uniref:hypothetical protein n=1 Tax=Weizmannia acidilactici TaxID=2607726 RepID=UPI00156249CC|nr:hypothetical protein [Weizmannia acidilactici]